MSEVIIPELEGTRFIFTRRPNALAVELRPYWRVGVLTLILSICCRGGKSNLQRLYVLNWAVRTKGSREEFMHVVNDQLSPEDVIVRFDPGLLRAIDFAIGEKVVERVGGDKIALTESGKALASELLKGDVFVTETEYLIQLKNKVPETKVKALLAMDKP